MALTKKIDFGNGVSTEAAYIIISNISLDFVNKTANFTIKTYLNKDIKDQGLSTILPDERFNVGGNINNPINPSINTTITTTVTTDLFSPYFLTGDAQINAENYLKTLPKYSDCTII